MKFRKPQWSYALRMLPQVAGQTGFSSEQLYGSFSEDGNLTLRTMLVVVKALGIEMTVKTSTHV